MLSNQSNSQKNRIPATGCDCLVKIQNCCRPSCPWPPKPCPPCCHPCHGSVCFTITKKDRITGMPISGAVYGLFQNEELFQSACSDKEGGLKFKSIPCGVYELREIKAPEGYQTDTAIYILIVHKNGTVEIDRVPLPLFNLYDLPENGFYFFKSDAVTGLSIPGAEFSLDTGLKALSDDDGLVFFGILAPGYYSMTETATVQGYLPNTHVYAIIVMADGSITVDGIDYREFEIQNQPV